MKALLDKRIFIFLLLIYIFTSFAIFSLFLNIKEEKLQNYFQSSLDNFSKHYNSVHRKVSAEIFLKFINVFQKPDVVDVVFQASQTQDDEQLKVLRQKLMSIVKDDAKDLMDDGIKQIHFHLPNAISFLRMHKPSHFGDDLSVVRPSIVKVNKEKRLVTGYEIGRHTGAFRNIIPLFSKDKFIGSLEISFDEYKLISELEREMSSEFDFIIEREFVDSRIYKSEKKIYHESGINNKYYSIDKIHEKLKSSSMFSFIDVQSYMKKEGLDEKLKLNKPFYVFVPLDKNVLVLFIPVKDLNNKFIGYFKSYEADIDKFEDIYDYYYFGLSLSLFILTGFMVFISTIIMYNRKIALKQKYFDVVFNTQKDIIVITEGTQLSTANSMFFKFLGYKNLVEFKKDYDCICDRFEVVEKDDYIYKDKGGQNWVKTVEENSDIHYKAVIIKDDKPYVFSVTSSSMKFDEAQRSVVVLSDITELIDIQDNLEKKVQEGIETIHKQEILMFQQAKQASLGEMIAMIAHQWRQPLSAISVTVGSLQMKQALDKYDKEYFDEQLEKISDFTQHLSSTIDDFREFFKEEKKSENVLIEDVIESSLEIINSLLINKNIFVNKNYRSNKKTYTYPNELKQVFLNLFKNSEDIFVEKEIKDAVIVVETYNDENCITVSIEDNAGGIPEKIIDRVFEPYFTTKEDLSGTGLGLYMSKTIVESHIHGKISVENTDNGARFTIKIPIKTE